MLFSTLQYTIEFQKRGLSHAHILLFLHSEEKNTTTLEIDNIISAETPNCRTYPVGYATVSQFMLHGPCGKVNIKASCMPKNFAQNTFQKHFVAVLQLTKMVS